MFFRHIVHATASHPLGPYTVAGVALDASPDRARFDGVEVEDPSIVVLPGGEGSPAGEHGRRARTIRRSPFFSLAVIQRSFRHKQR